MEAIIKKLKAKDKKAFEYFYLKYSNYLALFAKKNLRKHHDEIDIVHDCFYLFMFNIDSFKGENECQVKKWLFVCTQRLCIKCLESDRKYEEFISNASYFSTIEYDKDLNLFEDLKKVLTEFEYKIIYLKFNNDYTNKEIAKIMNVKGKKIKNNVEIAYKKIREYLKEKDYYEREEKIR